MVTITKIEPQKRDASRFNLHIDGEFFCGVHIDVVVKYALEVGREMEKELLQRVVFESEKSAALSKAVNYMKSAMKTEAQVSKYLKDKGFSANISQYVIDKLIEYRYLNDEEYVVAYISANFEKFGEYKLRANLLTKGVRASLVDKHIKKIDFDEAVVYNLAIKYLKNKDVSFKNLGKLARFLASRGFSFDDINAVLERINDENK